MWRWLIAVFFVLHGLVFVFLAEESWLVGDAEALWYGLGGLALAALTVAAVLLVARRESWRSFAAAGAALSLAQLLLFFRLGLWIGVCIDVAILAALLWLHWPSPAALGTQRKAAA